MFEGALQGGNLVSLQAMARSSTNPNIRFLPIPRGDHFSVLSPTTRLLAEKILRDEGPACNLTITDAEMGKLLAK